MAFFEREHCSDKYNGIAYPVIPLNQKGLEKGDGGVGEGKKLSLKGFFPFPPLLHSSAFFSTLAQVSLRVAVRL